ncbi:MAG: hypothetical protein Q4F21_10895 [Lachnospiraceae bacterium]|nr:hypothetical protein [Lachnospiraceae bacterium]
MYTEISLEQLRLSAQRLQDCENKLKKECEALAETQQKLKSIQEAGIQELSVSLGKQKEQLYREMEKVRMLRIALEKIVLLYIHCEEDILESGESEKKTFPLTVELTRFGDMQAKMEGCGIRFR